MKQLNVKTHETQFNHSSASRPTTTTMTTITTLTTHPRPLVYFNCSCYPDTST